MSRLIKILCKFINDFFHDIIYVFLGPQENKSSLHKMNNGKYIYVEDAEFEEIID